MWIEILGSGWRVGFSKKKGLIKIVMFVICIDYQGIHKI